MNTKLTVENIGEATTTKAGETRKVAKAGKAGTKLGIEVCDITAKLAKTITSVVGNCRPYGLLHGGATVLLVEYTVSAAARAWVTTHGMAAVGANLMVTHMRPAQSGVVRCTTQAQRLERRTAVYAFQVVSETSGKLISLGSVDCQLAVKNPGDVS